MRIALDAMGGDHAPGPIVAGAVQAVAADPDLRVVLVGDQAQIEPLLAAAGGAPRPPRDLSTAADSRRHGRVARSRPCKKPDNSISRCWQLLAEQARSMAIVSAGNTGAMVAGGLLLAAVPQGRPPARHRRRHADRQGPVRHHRRRRQRLPASRSTCSSTASWAAIFAKHILARSNPTIGLMNVGEEEGKGHDLAVEDATPCSRPAR